DLRGIDLDGGGRLHLHGGPPRPLPGGETARAGRDADDAGPGAARGPRNPRAMDFHGAELEELLEKIVSKPKAWLEIMMAHELNLAPVDSAQARKSAVLVGIAAIVGSLIPLVPFIVIGSNIVVGAIVSLAVSTLAL